MPQPELSSALRADARAAFAAAVAAVDPAALVAARVARDGENACITAGGRVHRWPLPLTIVAAGKPAAAMTAGCAAVLGADAVRGVAVTADGCERPVPGVRVVPAGHPLPDARGVAAAAAALAVARAADAGLLVLLGGGASSLLVQPRPPLTLADKVGTTRLLLACGADIGELNTVRKHLSLVKGGGLLRAARHEVVALLLSDVVGDDPATIGSGPSVPDPTTFADALAVLARHRLRRRVPASVLALLERGAAGAEAETVKPADAAAARATTYVLGGNGTALGGAAAALRRRGFAVDVVAEPLTGDTTAAAIAFARRLPAPGSGPRCVLAGGETTVVVRGGGRGGRNQEFAAALAVPLAGSGWVVLSAGTDGIDGPTDAAGAFVDGTTAARARRAGLDLARALEENDSWGFFAALGDGFRPGATGTNVMDIKIALHAGVATADR